VAALPLKTCFGLASNAAENGLDKRKLKDEEAAHAMTDEDEQALEKEEQALRAQLAQLRQEHGDLDAAIAAIADSAHCDQLQLTRLKKRKLQLKDQITQIEDSLLPDITA
jgi:hypothetical protein